MPFLALGKTEAQVIVVAVKLPRVTQFVNSATLIQTS